MQLRSLTAGFVALCIGACTPALDWREVRPHGSAALAVFPCRPLGNVRSVVLAGSSVEMAIHSCKAGQAVFALGFADVGAPGRVTPALLELREAATANVASVRTDAQPIDVEGSTPNPHAVRLRLDGRRPDGAPVQEQLALFARGTSVYQATVLGRQLDAATVQMFFDGIKVTQ